MIKCNISCPSCGSVHNLPIHSLSEASSMECNICGFEVSLVSKEKPILNKKRATSQKPSRLSPKKRTSRRATIQRKKPNSDSSKYVVNVCIGGLAFILITVLIAKLSSGSRSNPQAALNQEVKTNSLRKSEITALKKQLPEKQMTEKAEVAHKAKVLSDNDGQNETEKVVELGSYPNSVSSNLVVQKAKDAPSLVRRKISKKASVEENPPEIDERQVQHVSTSTKPVIAKTILVESDQNELDELSKVPMRELTEEEKVTLSMLKNKYNWYKANRYKMTREKLDYEWDRRWSEIQASNDTVKSRSDSLLPRSLQILLAVAKTKKERYYLMRIYQKPVSFEEKQLVRKAKNQAEWERRKEEPPKRYPEDKKKKKKKKYIDEYGYEYYLDERGQRIYL